MAYHKELKFDSEEHNKLRDAVRTRFQMSKRKMALRDTAWTEAENLFLSYVPETEEERRRKSAQKHGDVTFAKIVIPYSYATLLTAHTYWASVFLARAPIMQYTGRHGESHQKVQAIEALIDYQMNVGRMMVPLYLWLLDAGKYGMGVLGHYWTEETSIVAEYQDMEEMYLGMRTGKITRQLTRRKLRGYAGNRVFNVRPQDFYPDPRVSIGNFQDGEFCARVTETSWNSLRKSSEEYFNLKELRDYRGGGLELDRTVGSTQIELPDMAGSSDYRVGKTKDMHSIVEMVWDLVPSEWGLGDSDYPEKWVLSLADQGVVIGCRPQGLNHDRYPYDVMTYEMDGYSHTLRGIMEIIQPLASTLDWLFNSHMFNVRKTLNNQFVVDPSKIIMKDLLEGGPGKLIRLNPMAYGTDTKTAVHQLQAQDITRSHIQDAQIVMDMIQRIFGVTDNIMGMVNTGGRKTATEVRSSTSFGINRLKTFAEYNSAMAWAPFSQKLLQNTQQFYDAPQQFKIAGDLMMNDPAFLMVNPEDILGFYDFIPVDGTMPIDRFAQANLWKELLLGIGQMPQIAASYDLGGIFSWMAQLAGLKNITQFKIAPDAAVAAAAQAGNLVPQGPGAGIPPGVSNIAGGSPANQTESGLMQ
ncbi:MAG TPA: hypothetical protein VF077_00335 [Nitrospiraceae bacterium]